MAANNLAAIVTDAAATSDISLLRADKNQREGKIGKMRSGAAAIKRVRSRQAAGGRWLTYAWIRVGKRWLNESGK